MVWRQAVDAMDEDHDGNLIGAAAGQAQLTCEGDGFPLRLTEQNLLGGKGYRIEGDHMHAKLCKGRGDSQNQD
jgi:hypothetical protein